MKPRDVFRSRVPNYFRGISARRLGENSVTCPTCKDLGWVCENHPNKSWQLDGCQCGACMPCVCNLSNPPRFIFKEIFECNQDLSLMN